MKVAYYSPPMLGKALLWLSSLLSIAMPCRADWPTFRHDQSRSGVTSESVDAESLGLAWAWQSKLSPAPAWPDAARWDAYSKVDGLRSMRDYDPVFHPVIVGERLLFSSNADDSVHCLSLVNGKVEWTLTTDGPVRVAPCVHEGVVYFGSDDGCVYAAELESGDLIWRKKLVDEKPGFINDGRICSFYSIRTGVLVDEQQQALIVGCGLFPWKPSHLFALDLNSGSTAWQEDLGTGWTIEGPMLLGKEHLVAPQGRAAPQLFSRASGKAEGTLEGGGGSFLLLTDDQQVWHGPGNKSGWLSASAASSREMVANFEGGMAAVVAGSTAFILDTSSLTALDRGSQSPLWKIEIRQPQEVILAGDTLFVGATEAVAAVDATTGRLLWAERVTGRAIGLAFSSGHLVVSTDEGEISVFATGATSDAERSGQHLERMLGYHQQAIEIEKAAEGNALTPLASNDESLLERWLFHQNQLESSAEDAPGKLATLAPNGHDLSLPTGAQFRQLNAEHCWVLGPNQESEISKDFRSIEHPERELTVVATVRVDRPQSWGGLLSIAQDNGSYEKGWMLGFQKDRFGFAVNAAEGEDKLTWTLAKSPFSPQQWYHVVGTFDGEKIRLYVNGVFSAESDAQGGSIQYPEAAAFHLGSYKDRDEQYFTHGRLNEIALFDRALTEDEVQDRYAERQTALGGILKTPSSEPEFEELTRPYRVDVASEWKPEWGPEFVFTAPGQAQVSWKTVEPSYCKLEIVAGKAEANPVGPQSATNAHEWTIRNVARYETVRFRMLLKQGDQWIATKEYECDGHFDFTRRKLSEDADPLKPEWKRIIEAGRPLAKRGIAIVLGGDDEASQLAAGLATGYGLDVVEIVFEPNVLAAARRRLLERGYYGRPVSLHSVDGLEMMPDGTANLILVSPNVSEQVSDRTKQALVKKLQPEASLIAPESFLAPGQAEAYRVSTDDNRIFDDTGVAMRLYTAPVREGAAGWTHMYGQPDNSAYAGETLGGADSIDQLRVAWAGRPGPRYQSDRGNRKPSPLATDGRLFLQGLHRLIGMDAHNGQILWSRELPEMVRFNVPRDCSNWCADEQDLFVAVQSRCKVIDGRSGEDLAEYEVWNPTDKPLNWGFVARRGELLLGTGVRPEAIFTEFWGSEFWYDAKEGEAANKVCSDCLFALDAKSGLPAWTYHAGLVVNPTISMQGNKLIFVECRSQTLQEQKARRLGGEEFWEHLYVVCLNVESGEKLWEVAAQPMPGVSALYGVCSPEHFLLQTSDAGNFALYALDLQSGKMDWRGKYAWEADHHGKHLSRPAVVGDKIYLRPLTLDLKSGKVLADKFPVGHQCGTYTATSNALFLRAGNLSVWDGESTAATRWERLRPDCWISTIPAEGMLLSPEGGGGCSCGGWIETSIGFSSIAEQ